MAEGRPVVGIPITETIVAEAGKAIIGGSTSLECSRDAALTIKIIIAECRNCISVLWQIDVSCHKRSVTRVENPYVEGRDDARSITIISLDATQGIFGVVAGAVGYEQTLFALLARLARRTGGAKRRWIYRRGARLAPRTGGANQRWIYRRGTTRVETAPGCIIISRQHRTNCRKKGEDIPNVFGFSK